MRHVEHLYGASRQYLKAPGQFYRNQRVAHRAHRYGQTIAHPIERGERSGGIGELMGSAQRRMRQTVSGAARSAITPLSCLCHEIEVHAQAQQFRADRRRMLDQPLRRIAIGAYRDVPGAKDSCFLATDVFARRAKIVDVIDCNGGHGGHIGIDDIDGVEASAESDFQHQRVDSIACKQPQRCQRSEFEIGERDIVPHRFDRGESRAQCIVAGFRTRDAHALVVTREMGRSVQADTIACRREHAFGDRAGRALAVGTRYGDDGTSKAD